MTDTDPPGPLPRSGRVGAFVVVLAALGMLGPFSIDTPFPAFPAMAEELDAGSADMQLVVGAYLLAFGLMSPFHGPLSDALGRRPVMVGGLVVYAAASIGCAMSTSLEMLLAFRVLQGVSAGGGVIVSRTVIRDVFAGPEAQRLMSTVMMIFALAPAVAPVIGGLLLQVGPWPGIFWFMTLVGLVLVGAVVWVLPETHPPERRTPLRLRPLVASLVRPGRSLVFHRIAWAAALGFGGYFLYIGAATIIVVDLLGKGELDYWMLFMPLIGGIILGSWVSGRAAGRVRGRVLVSAGVGVATLGALVNVGLAMLPTAAQLPWPVVGPTIVAVGISAAYPTQQLALLDLFPQSRGAAVSLFTLFTLMLNAVTASALAPHVTGSVLELALASACLVVAGQLSWLWHLAAVPGGAGPVGAAAPRR